MTLINTNKAIFENSKKASFDEKFIIFLFSFLPISLILGNAAINLNIVIIDLFFLFTCYHQKKWSWIKNKHFYFFISIWIYLILNAAIAKNFWMTSDMMAPFYENYPTSGFDTITKKAIYPQKESIIRSVAFIKFVIFLFDVQYFFTNSKKAFNQIFLYWSIIISIVLFDIIFEFIFSHNLLGFKSPSSHRIISFFKDELIVGGFVLSFGFIISGFLFKSAKNNLKKKILSNFFFILTIVCIYLSGERANFLKALIIASLILFLINDAYLLIKKKYIILLIIIGITLPTVISENIYLRQIAFWGRIQLYDQKSSIHEKYGHIRHFAHYETAWQMIKDYPIFGVGNRKFRYICHDDKYFNAKINYTYERCSNHPHQVHFELLSEQGVVGYLIIIFVIFNLLIKSFKIYCKTNDIIHLSSILFVVTLFIPLLPSGSLFSTFTGSVFWINLSLAHAFLNKTNY